MHPFREGNGRTGRIWLNLVIEKVLDKTINWGTISKSEYMEIMEKAHLYDDTSDMKKVFSNALIDIKGMDYNSYVELFMHNAVVSYEYEGYNVSYTSDINYKETTSFNSERDRFIKKPIHPKN